MKRVLVVSKGEISELEKILVSNDFEIVERDPDFIVCYGGDGTVLFAEREFPQVPKLVIKKSSVCRKCDYMLDDVENVLSKIKHREFKMRKEMKLEVTLKEERLVGLNEIQVHTKLPIYAVRFSIVVDGREFDDLIGDGVVVATPFGSTGYYRSAGGKPFRKGIGIAFNNLHRKSIRSFVTSEDSAATVKINRGPAWLIADNNEHFLELRDDDVFTIKKSETMANFIYAGARKFQHKLMNAMFDRARGNIGEDL